MRDTTATQGQLYVDSAVADGGQPYTFQYASTGIMLHVGPSDEGYVFGCVGAMLGCRMKIANCCMQNSFACTVLGPCCTAVFAFQHADSMMQDPLHGLCWGHAGPHVEACIVLHAGLSRMHSAGAMLRCRIRFTTRCMQDSLYGLCWVHDALQDDACDVLHAGLSRVRSSGAMLRCRICC
jgi:hypothetical protein